jgi:DNA-binding LacI/PurR family transcriptional regulator
MVPRLTTIRQPLASIGERTATLLHRSISGERPAVSDLVMPVELVVRESTAAV